MQFLDEFYLIFTCTKLPEKVEHALHFPAQSIIYFL